MSSDWLRYANQGATRNLPLSPNLVSAMSFLPEMGVTMEVFSGGQPSSGAGRVGSHRHDQGGAADVRFFKDGRMLDWSNPEDVPIFQNIVREAKAAGLTGFGAGQGYMQPGSMHIGYGDPAVWGAGGKGANAPEWLRSAYGDTPQMVARDTMAALGKGQKMEQMTPPVAPQQEDRKGFLGGLLGDPDRRARLAMALEGMTLNPNQGVIEAAKAKLAESAKTRSTNRTVEMLQRMGADPKLIELAQAGYAKEAIGLAYAKPKEPKIFEMGGRLVRYDPTTGATTEVYSSGPDTKAISEARKEFTSLGWVKAFADQGDAYGKIIKSIEDPSPSGDLALIFNFMKVLDPGSVVREGEFATAANAGSVDERVRGLYNRVISGERLTPEQRADFATRATKLYQGASEIYQGRADQYAGFATAAGLPVEQVIPDFSYGGELYKKPLQFQRPPPPKGVTEDQWVAAWDAMTDAERAEFLNGGQP